MPDSPLGAEDTGMSALKGASIVVLFSQPFASDIRTMAEILERVKGWVAECKKSLGGDGKEENVEVGFIAEREVCSTKRREGYLWGGVWPWQVGPPWRRGRKMASLGGGCR